MMKRQRLTYIDIANIIAILGVLFQHTAVISHFGNPHAKTTIAASLIQIIFLPAVGIFFMNSGATLINYRQRYGTEHFFKKRFVRVLVPFLIWSLFFYFYGLYFNGFGVVRHTSLGFFDFISAFINDKIITIFWFFYVIIQLYLFTPVLSFLSENGKKILFYVVCVSFICWNVFDYIDGISHIHLHESMIYQPLLSSSWIQYFIMGYLIKENFFAKKQENMLIWFGVIIFALNILNEITIHHYVFLHNINVFPYAVAIYLLIKRVSAKVQKVSLQIYAAKLASTSLGIYVLHPIVIPLFDNLLFNHSLFGNSNSIYILTNPIHILVLPFIIYVFLVIFILALKKTKLFGFILP
ncbi:acyltransferase [uncultured Limosilactobacillus sp.]|uniref:acyltransferase n=1 Tax=uncultured Limosilactobacillus sp. TaxID=2837629 RepID=UPI0025F235DE|nr:acyltransferase [uncultured Limosilactobacillus sp.]